MHFHNECTDVEPYMVAQAMVHIQARAICLIMIDACMHALLILYNKLFELQVLECMS